MRRWWFWWTLGLGAVVAAVFAMREWGPAVRRRGASVGGSEAGEEAGEASPRQCEATTRSGGRCTREAEAGSRFCWQHG